MNKPPHEQSNLEFIADRLLDLTSQLSEAIDTELTTEMIAANPITVLAAINAWQHEINFIWKFTHREAEKQNAQLNSDS